MAELGLILSKNEESRLVERALHAGCWLLPDVHYEAPQPTRISKIEEFDQWRKSTGLFFIQHPSFVKTPVEMTEIEKDGKKVFFIMQRNGGPTIDFMTAAEFEEGGRAKINPGFLAHHKSFWNSSTQRNEDMPPELLSLFRELSAEAKQMARRERVGVRTYWIGTVIQKQLGAGALHLGIVVRPKDTVTTEIR